MVLKLRKDGIFSLLVVIVVSFLVFSSVHLEDEEYFLGSWNQDKERYALVRPTSLLSFDKFIDEAAQLRVGKHS